MDRRPWMNDESTVEERKAARKAVSKVDNSKQVYCLECGSTTTKMELMTGESGFRRIGKGYYCGKCHGVMDRAVGS